MAGQGSNGYRGNDGYSGKDTDDGSSPGEGKNGEEGGAAGDTGKAYMSGITELSGSKPANSTPSAGLTGNTGWGGLNLYKYESVINKTSGEFNYYKSWLSRWKDVPLNYNNSDSSHKTNVYCDFYFSWGGTTSSTKTNWVEGPDTNPDGENYPYQNSVYIDCTCGYDYNYYIITSDKPKLYGNILWAEIRVHTKTWLAGKGADVIDGYKSFYVINQPNSAKLSEHKTTTLFRLWFCVIHLLP